MALIDATVADFHQTFGSSPEVVVRAPGRVNLIGEHTDYNDGLVLPCAIGREIVMASERRDDDHLYLHALDIPGMRVINRAHLALDTDQRWANYIQGVVQAFGRRGFTVGGANICFRGNIPIGSGLSSSAALSVAGAVTFAKMNSVDLSPIELVEIAWEAERMFAGVECGKMDQFISIMGKSGYAVLLDCRDLSFVHVPFPSAYEILICDSGIKHELSASAYNLRKRECDEAGAFLSRYYRPKQSLRDTSMEELNLVRQNIPEVLYRRAKHVITENERVRQCVEALSADNMERVKMLFGQSHESLKVDFEVSIPQLDFIVETANASEYVLGARLTGAGFGGCVVCIVRKNAPLSFLHDLKEQYFRRTGTRLSAFLGRPEEGASYLLPRRSPDRAFVTERL